MDLHQNLFSLRLPIWKTMQTLKDIYLARLKVTNYWSFLKILLLENQMDKIQINISVPKPSFYFHEPFQPLRSLTFAVPQENLGLQEISHLLLKALGS